MKTISVTADDMESRIARFADLTPLEAQKKTHMPQEAADIVWSRRLMSVIRLDEGLDTPINAAAPITGAGGITITLAACPPGTGPSLHAHQATYETFTVLQGRFEIYWNDDGGERAELGRFDTISVPPGVCRGFRNISEEEDILQVVVSGGGHDLNDIDFAPKAAEEIEAFQCGLVAEFEKTGLTFTAGTE